MSTYDADKIRFLFESYVVNQTPFPSHEEIGEIIAQCHPFIATTTSVTISLKRYNELIKKEWDLDHIGSIAVGIDGKRLEGPKP
jgi:hypothetical protein